MNPRQPLTALVHIIRTYAFIPLSLCPFVPLSLFTFIPLSLFPPLAAAQTAPFQIVSYGLSATKTIGPEGGVLETASGLRITLPAGALDRAIAVELIGYSDAFEKSHAAGGGVAGAVGIVMPDIEAPADVICPLIAPLTPGEALVLARPNAAGSAWADTGRTAVVDASGLSATFQAADPGLYGLLDPEKKDDPPWPPAASRSVRRAAPRADGEWGLIPENDPDPNKTLLILVHGDNSFRAKQDRWEYFLDWVGDNGDVDARYEIWRFRHDTSRLIGYDGDSGNAKELGDAIAARFGPDRPLLLLAHSRGGLVSRAYMCGYGDGREGDRVLGLVTLATPHHGSPGAVPDWGLETIKGKFRDTNLSEVFYDFTYDAVVNVADPGTMGLAWDNFDGPEHGIGYNAFSLESPLGENHVLSVLDANLPDPSPEGPDDTAYLPDRSTGTLAELNADTRYDAKIIAYGGYDTDLGLTGADPFNWLNLSFSDHAGLEMAIHVMANMEARDKGSGGDALLYMANDGMVPLQSALLLKKAPAAEPLYDVIEDTDWISFDHYEIDLKNLTPRMRVRKAVLCPDYDHLHMVEGKGGLLNDRQDFWISVENSLSELAAEGPGPADPVEPEVVEFSDSLPSFRSVSSGDNCFIRSVNLIHGDAK